MQTLYTEAGVALPTHAPARTAVLMIYTGGTLGMIKDATGAYVAAPALLERLMETYPQLMNDQMPDIRVISFDPPVDSSAIAPHHWTLLVRLIANHYEDYAGFVVAHGTDTLAYTASALSFAFDRLSKPVVVTGSQIPLSVVRNDAMSNLVDALLVASRSAIPEVLVVFDSKILRGNRSTKHNCFGRDAFSSPNYGPIGVGGTRLVYNPRRVRMGPRSFGEDDDPQDAECDLSHHPHRAEGVGDAADAGLDPVASPISSSQQCVFSDDVIILRVFPGGSDFVAEVINECAARMEEYHAHASASLASSAVGSPITSPTAPAVASAFESMASDQLQKSVAVVLSDGTVGVTEAVGPQVRLYSSSVQADSKDSSKLSYAPFIVTDVDVHFDGDECPPSDERHTSAVGSDTRSCPLPRSVPNGLLSRLPSGSLSPTVPSRNPSVPASRLPFSPLVSPQDAGTAASRPSSIAPTARHNRRWVGPSPSKRLRRGIVLATFGSGTVPPDQIFVDALARATRAGVVIVAVTQCQVGEVVLSAYAASSGLIAAGVVSGSDLTVEAAYTKLGHLLAQPASADPVWVRDRMQCNIRGEMFDQRLKSKSTSVSLLASKVAIF